MNATGRTVVQVLSGPTRQMLRRSIAPDGFNQFLELSGAPVSRVFFPHPAKRLPSQQRPVTMTQQRREFQRLKLSKPILALMDGTNALVLDVGLAGAFIEHYGTVRPGQRFNLTFRWQGHDVEFVCEVARSSVVRRPGGDGRSVVSHTGVRFVGAIGDADDRLQDLIATFVGRILAAQKSNAAGDGSDSPGATILATLGEARRMRSRGFVTYTYDGKTWVRAESESPRQPADGFTVAAHEDEQELEALCQTYENADEDGRNLIRLVAELSAVSRVPC